MTILVTVIWSFTNGWAGCFPCPWLSTIHYAWATLLETAHILVCSLRNKPGTFTTQYGQYAWHTIVHGFVISSERWPLPACTCTKDNKFSRTMNVTLFLACIFFCSIPSTEAALKYVQVVSILCIHGIETMDILTQVVFWYWCYGEGIAALWFGQQNPGIEFPLKDLT